MELNEKYWNERYLNNDFPWDIGSISNPLKEYFDQLKNKDIRILIPGAGNSYEAEYLHQNGFVNVFVLDYAPEPLNNFKKRVPDFPADHLVCEDFFSHTGSYDLIIEQTFFCAIDPALREQYVFKMAELLNKDGQLAGLLFDDKLNEDKPPYGGSKKEYLPLFSKKFVPLTFDKAVNSIGPRAGRELFVLLQKQNSTNQELNNS